MELVTAPPKTQQVADFIRKEISSSRLASGDRLLATRKFAKKLNVSQKVIQTAFKSLQNEGLLKTYVGRGTFVAKKEKPLPSQIVAAVINTDLHMHFKFPILLPPCIQEAGYYPVIFSLSNTPAFKAKLREFLNENPYALIMDGYIKAPLDILKNITGKTRLIIISRFDGGKKYPGSYILADYEAGGYMAVRHMIEKGRKKILVITFGLNTKRAGCADLFYRGCKSALAEAEIKKIEHISGNNINEENCSRIFSSRNRPDGIISLMDSYLVPILEFCKKNKIDIPDDVSMIGYHNTPWAESYQLASVSAEEEIIATEVENVLKNNEDRDIWIKPRIIFRQSCPE